MIFLFKDHSYKVYSPNMSDEKLVRKFEKKREDLEAILIETSTKLHSDTFILIKASNFKTKIEPFSLSYSIGMIGIDQPLTKSNTFTRTIEVNTVREFYVVVSMLNLLAYSEDAGDIYSLGDERAILVTLTIKRGKDIYSWDDSKLTIHEFLEREEMTCDTDDFLDVSLAETTAEMVEDGCYITRYNPISGDSYLGYYHHGKRGLLWLWDGNWKIVSNNITPYIHEAVDNIINISDFGFFGICMNKTGMLYMASYPFLVNYRNIQECSITLMHGVWSEYKDAETGVSFWESKKTGGSLNYVAYNPVDTLYMALYLPQYWDIQRYFAGVTPVLVHIDVLQNKTYCKSGEYKVQRIEDGRGLDIDLFAIISSICSMPPKNISFND